MAKQNEEWLPVQGRHGATWICERALRAASGSLWQWLGLLAAGQSGNLDDDHFAPARLAIAQYLRSTGRPAEALEVEAIGCNEPPPLTGFSPLGRRTLRRDMGG